MRLYQRVWLRMACGLIALAMVGCTENETVTTEPPLVTPPGIGFPGLNARVNGITSYDGQVIAIGAFSTAAGDSALRVAAWDGSDWRALNRGIDGLPAAVNAAASVGGRLYVGGSFTTAGSTGVANIASWDGTDWSRLLTGTDGAVHTMMVSGTDLLVGGRFQRAGGITVNNVARWSGSAWSAFGTGVGTGMTGTVFALTEHEGDLIAGGQFLAVGDTIGNNVARWNGTTWRPMKAGFSGSVFALASYQGDLYAAGAFEQSLGVWGTEDISTAGGRYVDIEIDAAGNVHAAYYDLTTMSLMYAIDTGSGWSMETVDSNGDVGHFTSLALDQMGNPHILYHDATNDRAKYAVNDGSGWHIETLRKPSADLTQVLPIIGGRHGSIVMSPDDEPWVAFRTTEGGGLLQFATRDTVRNPISAVLDTLWRPRTVHSGAFTGFYNNLLVRPDGNPAIAFFDSTAGFTNGRYARRSGTMWTTVSIGSANPVTITGRGMKAALHPTTGKPYVLYRNNSPTGGAIFATEIVQPGSGMIIWAGPPVLTASADLDLEFSSDGVAYIVYRALSDNGFRVLTWTGRTDQFGIPILNPVATLDQNAGWTPSIAFLNGTEPRVAYLDGKTDRLVFNERGLPVMRRRIARWDGSDWRDVDGGASWWIRSMIEHDGELYVAGAFTEVGGALAERIATWNGSSWRPLFTGLDEHVWSMTRFNGRLIVGGAFTHQGAFNANYIVDLGP